MNYEKDIKIDETSLDIEWLDQAALFMKYSKHLAQTRKEVDEAKQNIDIKKAEVDRKIRENPEAYGVEKITEGAIQSAVLTEDEYQEAQRHYLEVKYEMDMAQGAVNAFSQRKDALENLVRLYGQQYFAGPKVPRDLTWERKEKQKRRDAGVASKIMRNRNRS